MKNSAIEQIKRTVYRDSQSIKGRLVIAIQLLSIPGFMGWYLLFLKDKFNINLYFAGIAGILFINFLILAMWGNRDAKFWKFISLATIFSLIIYLVKIGLRT